MRLLLEPRLLWLLSHGRYTIARRLREHFTRDGVGTGERYTVFEFTTADGTVERHRATTDGGTEPFRDHEPLVYDPYWPDHATVLSHLPGAPVIEEDGTIVLRASAWIA